MKFFKLFKGTMFVLPLIVVTACSSTSKNNADNDNGKYSTGYTTEQQFQRLQQINTVYFDFDKYNIKPEFAQILDDHASFLSTNPTYNVVIQGHTDEQGTAEYNIALGERRAAAVKAYLQGRGVTASQMSIVSYGKEKPAVLGHDAAANEKNRRVVIVY